METIWYWQIGLSLATLAVCAWLLLRNRVTLSKLVFMTGMTAVVTLQLFISPIEKRIHNLERQLAALGEKDPNRPGLELALTNARQLYEDVRNSPGRIGDKLPVNLGMDFKGGTDILLALKNDPARFNRLTREVAELEDQIAEAKAAGRSTAELEKRLEQKRNDRESEETSLDADLNNAVDVIRRRLNNSGLAEIPVFRQGADRVLVQLPGMDSGQAASILNTISKQGRLEFRMAVSEGSGAGALLQRVHASGWDEDKFNIDPDTLQTLPDADVDDEGRGPSGAILYDWLRTPDEYDKSGRLKPSQFYLVSKAVELRGDAITSARAEPNPEQAGYFRVAIAFNNRGAIQFERVTGQHIHEHLAIVLDGRLQSAPEIQARIAGGNAVITGSFDQTQARQLDVVLKSGSLRAKIEEEYKSSIGATLGEDSIRSGLTALAAGLAATILFMAAYYLLAGVVTDIVLVINAILIVALLAMFNATLTLPGLAGLVLTIGMAIDANVLIFERIREERERGNPLNRALHLGYSRALVTIVDSNLTTLITAFILHGFGTETVRGFAVTLIFGLIAGMFCSLVLTRWIFDALIEYRLISDLKMFRLFSKTNFNFTGWRKSCYWASGLLCVACLALVFWRGKQNLGQDFTGGALMQIRVVEPVTMAQARAAAQEHLGDYPDARDSLQSYGKAEIGPDGASRYRSFVLRTQRVELDEAVKERLQAEGIERSGADEFRAAARRAFSLEPEGIEAVVPVPPDRAPVGEMAYRVTLSLRKPIAPRLMAEFLVDQPNIMPLWIGAPEDDLSEVAGVRAVATARVPLHDASGRERSGSQLRDVMARRVGGVAPDSIFLQALEPLTDAGGASSTMSGAPDEGGRVMVRGIADLRSRMTQTQLNEALTRMSAPEGDGDAAAVEGVTAVVVPEYAREGLSDEQVGRLGILVSVPARDALGRLRSVDQGGDLVREQFQAIQRAKAEIVDFTDPFPRFAVIGPSVASEMSANAFAALVFSLMAIFAYIWLRFQFRSSMGVAAVTALAHDVILCLGALALVDHLGLMNGQIDLTVVAALLTVVGYSLNDTIVVFDRIREHISETGRPVQDLVNRSLNETLSRTIITSATTLLVVLAMLLLGGEVIRGFAFTLFVGFMVGTYSSLCVASPMLVEFANWKAAREKAKLAASQAKLAARGGTGAQARAK